MYKNTRLVRLVKPMMKRGGYVRGYIPELLSHVSPWVPESFGNMGRYAWDNKGTLALLGALAAGGYYLYNKTRDKKDKDEEDDEKNYSDIPETAKPRKSKDKKSDKSRSSKYNPKDWEEGDSADSGSSFFGFMPSFSASAAPVKDPKVESMRLANILNNPRAMDMSKISSYKPKSKKIAIISAWLRK